VSSSADRLYALLPAVDRVRDAEHGFALRGLVAVLAEQLDVVDHDIERLYENWFIETADRWVVPYLGDLVGTQALATAALEQEAGLSVLPRRFSQRSYVANSIGYRRRKGTAAVLEQVALDVTGWRARAVEFFQLLATTQTMKHVRPANVATPDLRVARALAKLDGPFDRSAHTIDVRNLASPFAERNAMVGRGRYNVPHIGLFLWRLQPYRITNGWARMVDAASAGYTFDPVGLAVPLFNPPRTEREISHLAAEPDVPGRLPRLDLAAELEAIRQADVDGQDPPGGSFFRADSIPFAIWFATADDPDHLTEVTPLELTTCDLSSWHRPPGSHHYLPAAGGPALARSIVAGVDPDRGRLAFAAGIDPVRVVVDYSRGFSGDLGGGPYDRRDSTELWLESDEVTFQIGVTRDVDTLAESTVSAPIVATLGEAIAAWSAAAAETATGFGLIVVMDSARYDESLAGPATIAVPAGWRLAIVAADWPDERQDPGIGGAPVRTTGRIAADKRLRPHLHGPLAVRGTASANALNAGELVVSGLLMEGALTVRPGNLGRLRVVDCTLVPSEGGLTVRSGTGLATRNASLTVSLDRTISGPLDASAAVRRISIADSIVDGTLGTVSGVAIAAPGADLRLDEATVMGSVTVDRIEASNSLFTELLTVSRRQAGCVRFCHVPAGSTTPRRFRCQPDLALVGLTSPAAIARNRARLGPAFTSIDYGDPGYGQLAIGCARELRTGAEDGSEMGAFSSLKQPQREANLRIALDEYLRSGLDAGIFYVT
jgi:hypothetical protein